VILAGRAEDVEPIRGFVRRRVEEMQAQHGEAAPAAPAE
jgi:hypothetical protein